MFVEYERVILTLMEYKHDEYARYSVVGEYNGWVIYEMKEIDSRNTNIRNYWYMAINDGLAESLINLVYYDDSDKLEASELIENFNYYFRH